MLQRWHFFFQYALSMHSLNQWPGMLQFVQYLSGQPLWRWPLTPHKQQGGHFYKGENLQLLPSKIELIIKYCHVTDITAKNCKSPLISFTFCSIYLFSVLENSSMIIGIKMLKIMDIVILFLWIKYCKLGIYN